MNYDKGDNIDEAGFLRPINNVYKQHIVDILHQLLAFQLPYTQQTWLCKSVLNTLVVNPANTIDKWSIAIKN